MTQKNIDDSYLESPIVQHSLSAVVSISCMTQVAAHEAIHGGSLAVAREAMQQLYKIVADDSEAFPKGRTAVVLRNLVKVTMDAATAENEAAGRELAELFKTCASMAKIQGIGAFFQENDKR